LDYNRAGEDHNVIIRNGATKAVAGNMFQSRDTIVSGEPYKRHAGGILALPTRLKNTFSALTQADTIRLNDKNQLENTQINGYTDNRRSGGLSVFVGMFFDLFPTFAVMVR